jgi:hypothetical protein
MCDALGTIIVNHLSKNDLKDGVISNGVVKYSNFHNINDQITHFFFKKFQEAEPHELVELHHEEKE